MSLWRSPSRDGALLAGASAISALAGVAFWGMAARLYSPDQVGVAGTILTVSLSLASLANLSFGPVLQRYLPEQLVSTRRLMRTVRLASAGMGLLLGVIAVTEFTRRGVFSDPTQSVLVVVGIPVLAAFALQSSELIGLGAAHLAALANVAQALSKLLALALLAAVGQQSVGILLAWLIPTLLLTGVVHVVISKSMGSAERIETSAQPMRTRLLGYGAWSLSWMIAQTVPGLVLPVMVLEILGPAQAAYFTTIWAMVTAASALPAAVAAPFISASAAPGANQAALTRAFIRDMALANLVRALGLGVVAPAVLALLGGNYLQAGAPTLLVFAGLAIVQTPAYVFGDVERMRGDVRVPTLVQWGALVLLLLTMLAALPALGLLGLGVAWAVHDVAVCAVAMLPLRARLRQIGVGR